jgi:hypothetical protein
VRFYVCRRAHIQTKTRHVKTHKLLQVCKQVVTNLFTSCQQVVFALLVPSCCNKFGTSFWQLATILMALSDLLQGCSNKSDTVMIQVWYSHVTRLTTQGCNNIVISWLHRTCWNNLATSLIISTRLLQFVNSLFQTCWQLGTSSAKTTCWRLVGRLATRCKIFACVHSEQLSCATHMTSTCMLIGWLSHHACLSSWETRIQSLVGPLLKVLK